MITLRNDTRKYYWLAVRNYCKRKLAEIQLRKKKKKIVTSSLINIWVQTVMENIEEETTFVKYLS